MFTADGWCFQAALCEEELGAEQAELTGSMLRMKLELEEKKRTVGALQAALVSEELRPSQRRPLQALSSRPRLPSVFLQAQQRELTERHVEETEKELSRNFQLQKEQYEGTIQRHLTFIDQVRNGSAVLETPVLSSV